MRIIDTTYERDRPIKLAMYSGLADVATQLGESKIARKAQRENMDNPSWAGGTYDDALRKCKTGDVQYADRAAPFVTDYSNVAIREYAIDMDYGREPGGMIDMAAYNAGEPDFMYGPTYTHTDRAPIAITLDQWIWSGINPSEIERRGIAAIALAQALSLFRPVMLYTVLANRHEPSRTDCVQIIPAPTAPLDLARCGYMLAAPVFVRAGLMPMLHHIANDGRFCGIPALSVGATWQANELHKWLAPHLGVDEDNIIHLPMMRDPGPFKTDKGAGDWVKESVKRYSQ